MADKPDIAARLADMGSHPDLFSKKELAVVMLEAVETIETLRILVGIRQEIELEDAEPEGNA